MEPTVPLPPPDAAKNAPSEFDHLAANALRVAERFCTHRTRCKPAEMIDMFNEKSVLVMVNNVVFGPKGIWAALEDGQRFTHLTKWYTPWRICSNTLDYDIAATGNNNAASGSAAAAAAASAEFPKVITVEREGRIFTGLWFWDPRHMRVRETCVVEEGKIRLFATQRQF